MKIVTEEIEATKPLEDSNKNITPSKIAPMVTAVSPTYAKAVEDEEKEKERIKKDTEDGEKKAKETIPEQPSTGKPLAQNIYTKTELDEGLFEDFDDDDDDEETSCADKILDAIDRGEVDCCKLLKKLLRSLDDECISKFCDEHDLKEEKILEKFGFVEDLPNDVYTLVYDLLFAGNLYHRPHLVSKEEEIIIPEDKACISLEENDIGAYVKEDEEDVKEYIEKIAKILHLDTYEKRVAGVNPEENRIVAIRLPRVIAKKSADAYLKEIGIKDTISRGYRKEAEVEETEVEVEKKDEALEKKIDESARIYMSLSDYKPWSGAVDTFNKIMDAGKFDALDELIEDEYPDGITDTGLNDLLWFDSEWVLEMLGIAEMATTSIYYVDTPHPLDDLYTFDEDKAISQAKKVYSELDDDEKEDITIYIKRDASFKKRFEDEDDAYEAWDDAEDTEEEVFQVISAEE